MTHLYLLGQTKIAYRSKIFGLLKIFEILNFWSGSVKIQQIPYVIFESTSQFFFKLCITVQCQERKLFCTFLAKTLYDFYKRSPSKCKILDFQLLK